MEYLQKVKREMDVITSIEQKNHVITKYLLEKELTFKIDPFDRKAVIKKILEGGEQILVQLPNVEESPEGNRFILYMILAKYIQLECILLQKLEKSVFALKVEKLAIARKNRDNQRFPVKPGAVYMTNVISSKTIIEANMFNIPTLVKVNFEDYKNRLKQRTKDIVNIDTFRPGLDRKFEIVKKTFKYLLIENTQDPNSYKNNGQERINYEKEVDDDLSSCIRKYKDQKIVSELIVPIIYVNHAEERIPIGYFSVQSKDQALTEKYAQELQVLAKDMVERIKESNTMKTPERFQILEASKGGIKVKIDHPHLIETLPKQDGFVFDIFFRMQAPFTVHGLIRWFTKDANNHLILGIELTGKSDLPGERARYESNINLLSKGQL
ncbi:DUF1577 domain-containing protein [Leptospira kmetyi]|uniref:DUF1577 domain-containing protein n=1 Tax=Leptospira kmetyi TaxID=408139 RepID=A0A5F1XSW3_9LEPT|nr:DUF1577 domain-containing protein [Leptospira kmetyi]AYV56467.1 DUF1577 domain-containing protein [Leptospira kmetyi]EQA53473.1 PF07614 family protein [Leptospira kmetyi serovar Malaysia str. Bejo-Iso9]PJZ28053.1 DUF1577 domain-containing protein [Leptospira kmetyi]TGK17678.1 DUF1577 domain-containing protein [Leptospira kmetyi]TGK25062.1 DUF1577 domain-containing protein [Leptospira kmetyi]